ncbi:hypothetical protein AgCh_036560 [Apium graveolens]
MVKLKAFSKFENTSEAMSGGTLLIDSKHSKGLRKFLCGRCDGETRIILYQTDRIDGLRVYQVKVRKNGVVRKIPFGELFPKEAMPLVLNP